MNIAGLFLIALAVAALLTPAVRALARRFGIVAAPRTDRWHQRPTALMGGVAIYATFLVGWFGLTQDGLRLLPVLAGATVLSVVGFIDDLRHLKPFVRLVIQVAVAATVVYFGAEIRWTGFPLFDQLTCIFWLVGITNALNLLDNMDGLAGGIGIISCVFLGINFALNGQPEMLAGCAILAGALAGFLIFNFHPASIFMGDCGSTFLGFMLAGVSLLSATGRSRNLAVVLLAPVLILLIPIFDTTLVTLTRTVSGRPASQGGKDHTSHRLVALGMSEVGAVVTLYILAAASGTLALSIRLSGTESLFALVPAVAIAVVLLGVYLGKVRIYKDEELPPQHTLVTALTHFGHKRRVFEIVLDVILIALAYYSAYLLRFETGLPAAQMRILIRSLPLVIGCQMVALLIAGIYSGLWRYTGLHELLRIVWAGLGGVGASALVVFAVNGFAGPSRAVFVLDLLLVVVMLTASRLSFRLLPLVLPETPAVNGDATPVLIYGAGDGGELLIRELRQNPTAYNYTPIGFIDDDWRKAGRVMHGCRIFRDADLPELIRNRGVRDVLVSSSKVPTAKLDHLRAMGVRPKRMSIRFE